MDPRILQIVFFPILIFASAFNAQFHILERRLGQVCVCVCVCFRHQHLPR